MCITLVNLSYKLKGLSSSEHSVLNVMSFRANDKGECWPSIKSLCESTSLNEKTVQLVLLSLVEKKLIIDTEKRTGRTNRIPVYKLVLNTPKIGGVQNLNTPYFSGNAPKIGGIKYPLFWGMERQDLKDKRKENFSSSKGPKHLKELLEHLEEIS